MGLCPVSPQSWDPIGPGSWQGPHCGCGAGSGCTSCIPAPCSTPRTPHTTLSPSLLQPMHQSSGCISVPLRPALGAPSTLSPCCSSAQRRLEVPLPMEGAAETSGASDPTGPVGELPSPSTVPRSGQWRERASPRPSHALPPISPVPTAASLSPVPFRPLYPWLERCDGSSQACPLAAWGSRTPAGTHHGRDSAPGAAATRAAVLCKEPLGAKRTLTAPTGSRDAVPWAPEPPDIPMGHRAAASTAPAPGMLHQHPRTFHTGTWH